jgi:hypothetical protein
MKPGLKLEQIGAKYSNHAAVTQQQLGEMVRKLMQF